MYEFLILSVSVLYKIIPLPFFTPFLAVCPQKVAATTEAPSEQPGARRTAEMKMLYGTGSAMIHGMETAMQLNFNRNCDRKQAKMWPQIPLKIKF